jgi:hypothetical protein
LAAGAAALWLTAGQDAHAGTTGTAVTISLSGSTAMRNFTTSEGFSLVNPGSVVNIGGANYPSNTGLWSPGGELLSFQLAPFNASGAVTTGPSQAANALRLEWHEQGSVEGILELANDQIAPIGSVTATNRNPTTGNPIWVNRNSFNGTAGKTAGDTQSGYFLGPVNTVGGAAQFTTSGLSTTGGQNAVQMASSDVNARQGFSVAGAAAFNRRPGQAGYGKGNAALALGTTTQGLGQSNVRHELTDATALNMSAAATNPRTGAAFGAGPWNTAGVDNLDNKTVAITATLFVANPGTGLDRINRADAQFLQAAGRLANGADFNVATRDVNSGTLNVAALNAGLDPSFAVGENDAGNGNAPDGGTAQVQIGANIKFSNKTSGGSGLRPTVQNARMALGHLSISDAIGSTRQGTARPIRALAYRDDDNDLADGSNTAYRPAAPTGDQRDAYADPAAGTFVAPSAQAIVDGSYVLYQNQTYVTVKRPTAATAGDTAAQWAARTDAATGIQGDSANNDVANFRANVLSSVATFPRPQSAATPADALVDQSFILPQFMAKRKDADGINQSHDNPGYDATLSGQFLGSSLVDRFTPDAPNTVTKGSSSTYGATAPAGTGAIAITEQNYLFGNFRQTGVRDFAAVKAAQDAQAKLFALDSGVSMFAGSANATVVPGVAAPLAAMSNSAGGTGATKGDLIVMGDFNADGRFDGRDLHALARGAALADTTATDQVTLAAGETFGGAIRRAVLRKNAALDYLHANATAQQKLDARASAANDPAGANAFNKFDVNRDGRVDRADARVVNQFVGKDYRNLDHQLAAAITENGASRLISLVDVELNDNGTITNNDGAAVAAGADGTGTSDFKLIRAALGAGGLLDGDADFDGAVGTGDFSLLASNFGDVSGNATWGAGDFDHDGRVTTGDFSLLAGNFGAALPGLPAPGITPEAAAAFAAFAAAVPEPGTASLAVLTAVSALGRRRRVRRTVP